MKDLRCWSKRTPRVDHLLPTFVKQLLSFKGWPWESTKSRSLVWALESRTLPCCTQRKHGLKIGVEDGSTSREIFTTALQDEIPWKKQSTVIDYIYIHLEALSFQLITYGMTEDVNSWHSLILNTGNLRAPSCARPWNVGQRCNYTVSVSTVVMLAENDMRWVARTRRAFPKNKKLAINWIFCTKWAKCRSYSSQWLALSF